MTITLTRRQFALASVSIAALSMAAPKTLFAAPKPGGTLVIGSTQVPRHFNGAVQSGIATAMPSTQIFASPLRYDDKRSEEHTSELQSLMRISYDVFCLKKKKK